MIAHAHSAGPSGLPQPLLEHLRAVGDAAALRGSKFGARAIAYWGGLWHDLGKFHPEFQAYLNDPGAKRRGPDHSSAGAVLAAGVFDPLAFPIAGHHAGLPSRSDLKARLAEKRGNLAVRTALEIAETQFSLLPSEPLAGAIPQFLPTASAWSQELFIRMLFSAIVDADYLDTEHHFVPDSAKARQWEISLNDLWNRFVIDQTGLSGINDSQLNRLRHEIYQQCILAAEHPAGVFSLTIPTGGGKTRSVMGFALRHAIRHGMDRVIVAIPYTSIIEQTADVYRSIFGDAPVLEHHSAIEPWTHDEGTRPDWGRLASENWEAPIVVTTMVQLLESLFANRPSRCRKVHNMARSVIVLDEAQTLPTHLLNPVLDMLKDLVAYYGVTVVLCTATQPALASSPYVSHLDGFAKVREIIDDPDRYFAVLKRVRYEYHRELLSWEDVADRIRVEPQALVVVNTKRDAMAILDALGDTHALHLSTLLCGAHRRDVLQEVRRRLAAGEPCRLVSTQVVEAGVDLDFPVVFRAIGPLDRIIQAAGRCNREGLLPEGRVVVFDPKEGGMPRGSYRTGADTARSLIDTEGFDFNDPAWYEQYFRRFYEARDLDEHHIQPLRAGFDYPEVAKRFRLIEDETVPVVVRYHGPHGSDQNIDTLLRSARALNEIPQMVFRRLQPYLVQIWAREVAVHERAGRLMAVRPGLWEWLGGYDLVRGLFAGPRDPDALVV